MKMYEIEKGTKGYVLHKNLDLHDLAEARKKRPYTVKNLNTFMETIYDPIAYHNNRELDVTAYGLSDDCAEEIRQMVMAQNMYAFGNESDWILMVYEKDVNTVA